MSLGEPHVRQALSFILERLREEPHAKRASLVDEASRRFDLTPLETDFLYRHLKETLAPPSGGPSPPNS